jgi:sugar lactone lactonase YvrE
MKRYTERYHAARRAEARPIFILFLETDRALRCFGKHTPTAAQAGPDALEWSARVLAFGDFRNALSSESEKYLQGLFEEEVSSYGAELDNADGYFSEINGKEIILNGRVILMQGYAWPDFEYDDFIPLYYGTISKYTLTRTRFSFNSIQSIKAQTPGDPTVDTTTVYAMRNAGTGTTGATGTFTYINMNPALYDDDSWEFSAEIDLDDNTIDQSLIKIENSGEIRLDIGINSSGFLYLAYNSEVGSPSLITKTSSIGLPTGANHVSVKVDDSDGTVTFKDGNGNSDIIVLPPATVEWFYYDQFGSSGTGNDQFNFVRGVEFANNSIYVADPVNQRIQRFLSDGTYLSQWAFIDEDGVPPDPVYPFGICADNYGNIFVSAVGIVIQKYQSDGTFLDSFRSDRGFGQIHVDVTGTVWVTDLSFVPHVIKFTSFPGSYSFLGTGGSGDGQFNAPYGITTDTLGNVYVADTDNHRIQKFDSSFSFITKWGSYGTSVGQFKRPTFLSWTPYGDLVVADSGNDRIQIFDTSGNFVTKFGSTGTGDGQFTEPNGIALNTNGNLICGDVTRVQIFEPIISKFQLPDFADTGNDDTVMVGDDFDGDVVSASLGNIQYVSTSNSNANFPDIQSGIDVPLDDGTWVDSGIDLEEVTEEEEEEEPLDPTADLILSTTGQYPNPGENNNNVVLPLPYGRCRANSDGGVWVCPLIDSMDFVYCVAGWPIQSITNGNTVEIYVDGVLQTSGYTFDESNDYENQGDIAIVDFDSDPGGTVTVKCNGKWVGGKLLTNPVDIIEDFLDFAADLLGNTAWEKDPTTFAIARNVAETAGYECAGVIQANNTIGYWIKAILKSFLGGFRFNSAGLLEIKLTPLSESEAIQEELYEYEAINCEATSILDNICGRIIINYAVSFAEIDRRFKNGGESSYFRTADKSQTAINPQSWELDFDWCRNTDNIELMQDILLALYADPEYIIQYQGQDFKFIPLDLTDQMQGTISVLRDSNNDIVQNVVFGLREKTINLDDFTTGMTLQSVNFIDIAIPIRYVKFNGNFITFNGERVIFN